MKTHKADTSHIKLCHARWYDHLADCPVCQSAVIYKDTDHITRYMCLTGHNLWDEYSQSIQANRDCEGICATTKN